MKQAKLLLATLLFSAVIASCSKNKDEETAPLQPTGKTYASLQSFFDEVALVQQTFQINSSTGGTITGNQGTQLTFPANAFVQGNGTAVTGTVIIELCEANTKTDMALGEITTATATVPLISGGQFKFVAKQNNQKLKFGSGKKAQIAIPTTSPDNEMVAYVQNPASPTFNYTLANDSSTYFLAGNNQYVGFTDSMTWVNCDHPFVQASYKKFTIVPDQTFPDSVTKSILVFTNIKTVVYFYANKYDYAPQGYDAKIFSIAVKNGKLYSSVIPITITSDANITPTFTETTVEQLKLELAAME